MNCLAVNHSNGRNINSTACGCIDGYIWSSSYSSCVVDCSEVINSTGPNKYGLCDCTGDQVFIKSLGVCVVGVDCSSLLNSPRTNFNATQCDCDKGFFYTNWSYIEKVVGVCRRDCLVLAHTKNTTTAPDYLACDCEDGYVWNSKTEQCSIWC